MQFFAGFGYIWLVSIVISFLMIAASTAAPVAKYLLFGIALFGTIAVWILIGLWINARLSDAGLSRWWMTILAMLFISELRSAFLHPKQASSQDIAVNFEGWDGIRTISLIGMIALLLLLAGLRSKPRLGTRETTIATMGNEP